MKKKVLAVLLATLMSATMFASIGVADIDVEIPKDAPDDVEIPNELPLKPMIKINDDKQDSKSDKPDLWIPSKPDTTSAGNNFWYVDYSLRNIGSTDITNDDWYDSFWLYEGGHWNEVDNITITGETILEDRTKDMPDDFYFQASPGYRAGCAWADAANDIDEEKENNNEKTFFQWW